MTFEQFENANGAELRSEAKACFERARTFGHSWMGTAGALLEAQFYMGEIDRRDGTRIARRDFRMELIVIALIGFELLSGDRRDSL